MMLTHTQVWNVLRQSLCVYEPQAIEAVSEEMCSDCEDKRCPSGRRCNTFQILVTIHTLSAVGMNSWRN